MWAAVRWGYTLKSVTDGCKHELNIHGYTNASLLTQARMWRFKVIRFPFRSGPGSSSIGPLLILLVSVLHEVP